MRTRYLGSIATLLVGASLAAAQPGLLNPSGQSGPSGVEAGPSTSHSPGLPPPVWSKPDSVLGAGCATGCADDCMPTSCHAGRLWFSGEYLFWWVKPGPVRTALVTTGTTGDPPGALDEADTRQLFPNDDISYKPNNGGGAAMGYAIDDFHRYSVELGMFALGGREEVFNLSSDLGGNPVISRPFFSTPPPVPFLFPGEDVQSVSRPGLFAGAIRIVSDIDFFGGEANLSTNCVDIGPWKMDVLVGMRYLYLHEELDIRNNTLSIGGDLFLNGVFLDNGAGMSDGISVSINDNFKTTNHFWGGQLGLRSEYNCGCWYVLGKTKVALGHVSHKVHVDGSTTATLTDGTSGTVIGGLLAQTSNIGEQKDSSFAVAPEAELTVGFNVNENIRLYAGYSFLYISKVLRPGEVIDRNVNPSLIPTADSTAFGVPGGPANPGVLLDKTDFWVHGLHGGVAFHW